MRQTSRAVALLLAVESAQAAATPNTGSIASGQQYWDTVWMPSISASNGNTDTLALNSRTAGYEGRQQAFLPTTIASGGVTSTIWALKASSNYQKATIGLTSFATATTTQGSNCMQCIGAKAVWCSRTYSYLVLTTGTYQLENANAGGSYNLVNNIFANEAALVSGNAKDSGSCCGAQQDFVGFVGNQSLYATPTPATETPVAAAATAYPMISGSCVAFVSTGAFPGPTQAANTWGTTIIDNTADTNYSSWWCSNGLYKKQLTYVPAGVGAATGTVALNAQQLIGYGVNKRMELAMVGCPQKADQCGQTTSASILTALSTGTADTTIDILTTGPTVNDKCTWVATATLVAPSFYMSEGATALGLVTTNWQIHAMEYTATPNSVGYTAAGGALESSQTADAGLVTANSALQSSTYIPRFNMPADQFATLRTWYGEAALIDTIDTTSGLPASWLTPGQAPVNNSRVTSNSLATVESQQYGNVVNVPASTIATTAATAVTQVGNTNFGLVNNIKFDLRVARYFPAQVAQTVWAAGSAQQALYVSSKSTYDTAKTAWDNYVALLEKNAKTDAFAALFSPPKAPTVPPMPNMPWLPKAYAGYVKATAQEVFNYQQSTKRGFYSTANAPTSQQFWTNLTAAQTVGGWGSFTAQILRYRNGWGKSFGTIGYSGDALKTSRSAVWNYMYTCNGTAVSVPSTTNNCDATYTYASATSDGWVTTTTPSQTNTVLMVSVVSLWSTSNDLASSTTTATEYAWTLNSFALTWVAGAWSNSLISLNAIAAPVAATAAKGLSGVAGAQALAATSAAALAVAAALY